MLVADKVDLNLFNWVTVTPQWEPSPPERTKPPAQEQPSAAATEEVTTDPFDGSDPFGCSSARNFPRFKF